MDDNGYSIHRGGDWIARDLTVMEVVAFLTAGLGRNPGPSDLTVVQQYDGRTFEASAFMLHSHVSTRDTVPQAITDENRSATTEARRLGVRMGDLFHEVPAEHHPLLLRSLLHGILHSGKPWVTDLDLTATYGEDNRAKA